MTEPTEEMKAMARRIALDAWPHDVPITEPLRRYMENAALAAIIEATEKCAELAEGLPVSHCSGPHGARSAIAAAIRSGKQYG